jgi:hypothetical protein
MLEHRNAKHGVEALVSEWHSAQVVVNIRDAETAETFGLRRECQDRPLLPLHQGMTHDEFMIQRGARIQELAPLVIAEKFRQYPRILDNALIEPNSKSVGKLQSLLKGAQQSFIANRLCDIKVFANRITSSEWDATLIAKK